MMVHISFKETVWNPGSNTRAKIVESATAKTVTIIENVTNIEEVSREAENVRRIFPPVSDEVGLAITGMTYGNGYYFETTITVFSEALTVILEEV